MKYLLRNGTIYTGTAVIQKDLIIDGGRISGFAIADNTSDGARVIDCTGKHIAPAFIDLQVYGAGGYLFSNDPAPEVLHAIIDSLVRSGTTGFFLTLATNSPEVFSECIRVARENPHPALLGIHFEGPYINPEKKGAHLEKYIKKPTVTEVRNLVAQTEGVLKMVTLAPEMCDPEIVRLFTHAGIIVSAGHSNATFEQAKAAFENGVVTTTHLFNAMSPLHHRNTGLPGAAYLSDTAFASIIADGIHVDFNTLILSKQVMKDRLFLITDAVEEVKEGAYIHVEKADRFTLPDGTLSGSKLTLMKAVENCVRKAGIPLDEALRMASAYPAKLLMREDLGVIKEGATANIVLFTDDFRTETVWLQGEIVENV